MPEKSRTLEQISAHSAHFPMFRSARDRKLVKAALDRAFSWACAHGADAIVMQGSRVTCDLWPWSGFCQRPTMSGLGSFRHPRRDS